MHKKQIIHVENDMRLSEVAYIHREIAQMGWIVRRKEINELWIIKALDWAG
jgi:hypothetical protein